MPHAGIVSAGVNIVGEQRLSKREKSINFRIHTLASSLSKGAMQYYGARFAVGLPEMRILSNLDSEGRLAAYQLVELTAMDKALVSRVLTMLNRRGFVTSSSPDRDPRRRAWQLTRAGRELVNQLRPGMETARGDHPDRAVRRRTAPVGRHAGTHAGGVGAAARGGSAVSAGRCTGPRQGPTPWTLSFSRSRHRGCPAPSSSRHA